MKDNVISESTTCFYDELGEYGLCDDFDNEAMNQDAISASPAAETQASEIDKLYAAYMIADAIRTVCGDDAAIFTDHCQAFDNLCEVILAEYAKLDYRQRTMIAARLGFDKMTFRKTKKEYYLDIAVQHTLSAGATASRIVKGALRELATNIIYEAEVQI